MNEQDIEKRTAFLASAKFDFEEREEINNVTEWAVAAPEDAAAYIVWLESRYFSHIDQLEADKAELVAALRYQVAAFKTSIAEALHRDEHARALIAKHDGGVS